MRNSHSCSSLVVFLAMTIVPALCADAFGYDPNVMPPLLPPMSYVSGDFYNGTGILATGVECTAYYDTACCKRPQCGMCAVVLSDYQGYQIDTHSLTPWLHVTGYIDNNPNYCMMPRLTSNTIDPINHCDFNGDQKTGFADYALLAAKWQSTCGWSPVNAWCSGRDINRDGQVNAGDLAEFAENWLYWQYYYGS